MKQPIGQPEAFDARDFVRGVKRTKRDFERLLRRLFREGFEESARLFDEEFDDTLGDLSRRLAEAYELLSLVGLRRDQQAIPPPVKTAFHLLHEALNLLIVALQVLRGGSELGALSVARQALELAAVAVAITVTPQRWEEFSTGRLNATKCIGPVAKSMPIVGRIYGCLSEHYVHPSALSVGRSLTAPWSPEGTSRIVVGSIYDPYRRDRFAVALLRVGQVAFAVHALSELAILPFVERPSFWRQGKAADGTPFADWALTVSRLDEFRRLEDQLAPSEDPLAEISPHISAERRAELEALIQRHRLGSISDVDELRAALRQEPASHLLRYLLAVALQEDGDLDEAHELYSQILSERGSAYDIALRLARIHSRRGEREQAVSRYEEHLRQQPDDFGSWNNLGLLLDGLGEYARAIEAFRAAQSARPNYYKACYNEGNTHLHTGNLDAAIEKYEEATRYDLHEPDPWHSRGVALLRKHDIVAAYRSFRRAVIVDRGFFASWLNLGVVAQSLGWLRKARLCFERASSLSPDSYAARLNLATTCQLLGDPGSAESHARVATQLAPERADAWHVLAHALETLGQQAEAEEAFRRWRALNGMSQS
jgi:tetratricopeptide (TPR) repeat protein